MMKPTPASRGPLTMTIEKAPPVSERPCCQDCGKRLKPNYDTEIAYSTDPRCKKRRVYRDNYYERNLEEGDYSAQQDEKGAYGPPEQLDEVKALARRHLEAYCADKRALGDSDLGSTAFFTERVVELDTDT